MKKIVVFGGTGGLGVQLVPLLKEKYNVIALGSSDLNITNLYDVKRYFETNDVDIVLNMAGVNYDTYLSDIHLKNEAHINNVIDVNINGSINILAGCLPQLIKKRYGRVIMISSVLSEMNIPKTSLYSASKAFVDRLIIIANRENTKFGITCNTIQLGYWDGGMCDVLDNDFKNIIKERIGLKRFGKIDELYNTINYIIDTEYVSGTNLKINGGI